MNILDAHLSFQELEPLKTFKMITYGRPNDSFIFIDTTKKPKEFNEKFEKIREEIEKSKSLLDLIYKYPWF